MSHKTSLTIVLLIVLVFVVGCRETNNSYAPLWHLAPEGAEGFSARVERLDWDRNLTCEFAVMAQIVSTGEIGVLCVSEARFIILKEGDVIYVNPE